MLAWWSALPEGIRQCWQAEETRCFGRKKDGQTWVHHSRSDKGSSRCGGTPNIPAASRVRTGQLGLLHRSSSGGNFFSYPSTHWGGPDNSCSSLSTLITFLSPVGGIRRVHAAPRACYTEAARQSGVNSEIGDGWVWEATQLLVRQGKQMRGLIETVLCESSSTCTEAGFPSWKL